MWTRIFFLDLLERAVKTFAQTFLAVWVPTGLNHIAGNWQTALIASCTAAVLSLLMSLASSGVGNPQSASLVRVAPLTVGRHELRRR